MDKGKLTVIGIIVVIVMLVSALIILENPDIFEGLSGKAIEMGDCADVHYIGKYENGNVFGYSYDTLEDKAGENYLQVFVSLNSSALPPDGYDSYSNFIMDQYYVEDFIDGLVGLKAGDKEIIGPIPIDESLGVRPQVGDELNLTALVGQQYNYTIFGIEEDVEMPSDYAAYFGNITTTMYVLREGFHYIGEIIDTAHTYWTNSTVVTKINDTLVWTYTTPDVAIGENFTWNKEAVDVDFGTVQYIYPTNTSVVTSINDSTIVVEHNPAVNSTIAFNVYSMYGGYTPYITYTVENVTDEVINASYIDTVTNTTLYQDFDRIEIIQRNETMNITQEAIPAEFLEGYFFPYIKSYYPDFNLSCSPFTEVTYIEVEVLEVYKTS